jgi:hypothetical protein
VAIFLFKSTSEPGTWTAHIRPERRKKATAEAAAVEGDGGGE